MKKIYTLALIILFLASVSTSFAQEREKHHPGRPGTKPAIPASVRQSNTKNPAAAARNSAARLRTQSNGTARTQQASTLTTAANYYVRNDEPWGEVSNINALDNALGAGNWSPVTFSDPDVLTIFDPATDFIFLEGSDDNALALNDFLIKNLATIESWVSNGGRLLLNAAPNEGEDMNFGFNGTTLNYNHGQEEVHVVGPLLTNPNVLSTSTYHGGSFSHAHITGNGISPLILGQDDEIIVLGEKLYNAGLVAFGGMTQSSFHSPSPDADNLMTNIIYYIANNNIVSSVPVAKFLGGQPSLVTNRAVTFLDISTGYPTDRTWTITPSTVEYTEGTNEHANKIKLKFTQPGTYTIKLTVSNASGQDEFVKTDIVVRSPYNFYWVGGSGTWSDHGTHWAKSSGGTEFYDIIPTEDDNVFFDANSFTADGEIVDMEDNNVFAANANFTGVTHTPELTNGSLLLSGSLTAPDPIKFSGWSFVLTSSESETVDISGVQFPNTDHGISINGTGSFDVVAPFTNDGYFELDNGAVTTNGHTISVTDFYIDSDDSGTPTIDFKNSELHVSNNFQAYYDEVYPIIGKIKLFLGKVGVHTYFESGDITIDEMTLIGGSITFDNNVTIGKLKVMPGTEFNTDDSNELTVGSIDIRGTADENITISNCIINRAAGVVVGEYLILSNVIATGGATFYADKNSVDNGGNDGWIFTTTETQNITFNELPAKHFGDANFALTASSSSGLPVTFEVVSGPATLSGNTVTITGAGEVIIRASQEGNDDFIPAQDVLQSLIIEKVTQTITFNPPTSKTLDDAAFDLTATGGASGNAILFSITSGPATLSGNTVTITGTGVIVIKASQAGNDNYNAAADVSREITVGTITGLEAARETLVKIYPNPTVNELIIDMAVINVQTEAAVVLYDAAGKTMTSTKAKGSVSIPMATYTPGRYIVVVSFGNQRIAKNIIKK